MEPLEEATETLEEAMETLEEATETLEESTEEDEKHCTPTTFYGFTHIATLRLLHNNSQKLKKKLCFIVRKS